MSITVKERLLRSSILAGFAAISMAGASAYAQEQDEEDEEDEAAEQTQTPAPAAAAPGETIVITGSRIRRDSFTSTAPLQVIDSEEIRDAGLIDVGEILSQTTVAQGVQIDNTIAAGGFVTDAGPGANVVSLRGLSADRTLPLVNGRRIAPAGAEGAPAIPDLNLIPSSLIQRIDVLLDGASSVYGSDAVAGVVNVVLRDEFEGVQADFTLRAPETGAGGSQRYSLLMGDSTDRSNFMFAVEYFVQDRLKVEDSDYNQDPDSGLYCYRNIWRTEAGDLGSRCTGAIINRVRRGADVYRTPGTTNVPGVLPVGWSTGDSAARENTSSYLEGGNDVIPQSQRYSLFFTGTRDLEPVFGIEGIEAFVEASHSNSQTSQKETFSGQLFPDVPADNPFNPFGVPVTPILSFPVPRNFEIEVQQTRLIGGLRGDMADFGLPEWDYELFTGYTRSIGYSVRNGLDEDRLRQSIFNTRQEADGSISCTVDITYVAFGFLSGDPCVPVNLFADTLYPIDGESEARFGSEEEREYLELIRTATTKVDQAIAGGFVTGPIFQLPAGDLSGVFGLEWRRDGLDSGVDTVTAQGRAAGFFADRNSNGSVSLWEAYGELAVPIASGQPFAEDITLDIAGRLTDHEFYGQNSTYSARLGWSPVDYLTLRATYGTSFRAPNVRELFLGGQTGFTAGTADPCIVPLDARSTDPDDPDAPPVYDPAEDDRDAQIIANCQAEGVDPFSLGLNGSASIESFRAGNPGLDPETSTAWSAGFVVDQPFTDAFDFTFGMSYFNIELEDSIAIPGTAFSLNQCYASNDFPNDPFCARRERDPDSGLLLSVDNTPFNVATSELSGIDFNTRFGADVDWFGGFRIDNTTTWTWSDEILNQTTPESAINNSVGDFGNPEWRGTITTRFTKGDWSALWRTRYIGEQAAIYNDTDDGADFPYGQRTHSTCSALDEGCFSNNDPSTPYVDFSSYVTQVPGKLYHDLSVTYSQDTWVLRGGVNNVFDEPPGVISGNTSGATLGNANAQLGSGYDLLGRAFFLNITKQF